MPVASNGDDLATEEDPPKTPLNIDSPAKNTRGAYARAATTVFRSDIRDAGISGEHISDERPGDKVLESIHTEHFPNDGHPNTPMPNVPAIERPSSVSSCRSIIRLGEAASASSPAPLLPGQPNFVDALPFNASDPGIMD